MTTGINFQPVGGGRAAINGDFVMTAPEVQKVDSALRTGGIHIVEVHNHSLTDNPEVVLHALLGRPGRRHPG